MKIGRVTLALGLAAATVVGMAGLTSTANAAALTGIGSPVAAEVHGSQLDAMLEQVQYARPYYRGYGPRPYAYGPPRAYGGPGWGYRPWYRRPYYGTIIGGIALGTIIGVTAYGLAPRPPRPDLCWYWADQVQSRGYWDYC